MFGFFFGVAGDFGDARTAPDMEATNLGLAAKVTLVQSAGTSLALFSSICIIRPLSGRTS